MPPALRSWLTAAPFAHRGLHGPDTGPENSLAAFAAAVAGGFAIECDIRLLADGEAVVFHDADLSRLTGRSGPLGRLSAADLSGLRLCGTDEHPPLLADVLRLVAGRVPLYLELKAGDADGRLVRRVLELVAGYGGPFCLASFDPSLLAAVRRRAPALPRCLIACARDTTPGIGPLRRFGRRHLFHAALARPHVVAYDWRDLPRASVSLARRLELPVLLWTVRAREDMEKALRHGDNIVFEGFLPPSPGNT